MHSECAAEARKGREREREPEAAVVARRRCAGVRMFRSEKRATENGSIKVFVVPKGRTSLTLSLCLTMCEVRLDPRLRHFQCTDL